MKFASRIKKKLKKKELVFRMTIFHANYNIINLNYLISIEGLSVFSGLRQN